MPAHRRRTTSVGRWPSIAPTASPSKWLARRRWASGLTCPGSSPGPRRRVGRRAPLRAGDRGHHPQSKLATRTPTALLSGTGTHVQSGPFRQGDGEPALNSCMISGALEGEVPADGTTLPPPSWVGRVLFRQTAALYTRKDQGVDAGPMSPTAWRCSAPPGARPRLGGRPARTRLDPGNHLRTTRTACRPAARGCRTVARTLLHAQGRVAAVPRSNQLRPTAMGRFGIARADLSRDDVGGAGA